MVSFSSLCRIYGKKNTAALSKHAQFGSFSGFGPAAGRNIAGDYTQIPRQPI